MYPVARTLAIVRSGSGVGAALGPEYKYPPAPPPQHLHRRSLSFTQYIELVNVPCSSTATAQSPASHTTSQRVPQVPQFISSVPNAAHVEPQGVSPAGQTHDPAVH